MIPLPGETNKRNQLIHKLKWRRRVQLPRPSPAEISVPRATKYQGDNPLFSLEGEIPFLTDLNR